MPSSRRKATAAALAACSSRTGGRVVGVAAWSVRSLVSAGSMAAMVVGVGAAAGWAGSSRATTKAGVTPIATASTPATATRRMWAGRIADPPVDAPCWSGRLPGSSLPVTKLDRRHLGHVPDRSPPGLGWGRAPLPADLDRAPHVRVDGAAVGEGPGGREPVREGIALLQVAG